MLPNTKIFRESTFYFWVIPEIGDRTGYISTQVKIPKDLKIFKFNVLALVGSLCTFCTPVIGVFEYTGYPGTPLLKILRFLSLMSKLILEILTNIWLVYKDTRRKVQKLTQLDISRDSPQTHVTFSTL